jgi:uncharacterized protein
MATISTSINADVRKSVRQYLAAVRKQYPLRAAYLFGSQATGRAHAWSDIDLALVSRAFAADPTQSQIQLMSLAASIDWRIEPHVFAPDDFNVNHPLVSEINLSGVSLLRKKAKSQFVKNLPQLEFILTR